MVPGLDGGVLAPTGLQRPASVQDQGVQRLLPPPSLTACQLQSQMAPPPPWQAAPLPFSSKLSIIWFLILNVFTFLLFPPQDMRLLPSDDGV
ncbi:hypothetical protein CgunFtcFv8_025534 [Champsocephalus gunnari]|uniref:Uncharacterized protein n=1 Tax=Champsocephalus gunnari TaxID=52237 RepID=A0AAN8CAK1_CHAGU|nr:hypothetical protein CgunFtcFv8_025534 [Champsocephalus gunnari]